ncbi:MAG: ADP-ribosylation factor-like protein [Candidatus Hodarchaeales archaeon]
MFSDFIRLIKGFILFIGPKEAGKTSILRHLVTGEFEETQPTLGFLEEHIAKVRVIEIGGHENYQEHWKTAIKQNPDHIFYTIDITQQSEYEDYTKFVKSIDSSLKTKSKITLLGNKFDLVDQVPEYLSNFNSKIMCSAKDGTAMMDILEEIIKYKTIKTRHKILKQELTKDSHRSEEETEKKVKSILEEFKDKF